MKHLLLVLIVVFFFSSFFSCHTKKGNEDTEIPFTKNGELLFIKKNTQDTITSIDIEVASTERKRELGLMYRHTLKPDHGMLFIFESEQARSFWMRSTYLSLDIIYVDTNNQIVSISENTMPMSDLPVQSILPAQYVLEVNSGFCQKHQITTGDRIAYTVLNEH